MKFLIKGSMPDDLEKLFDANASPNKQSDTQVMRFQDACREFGSLLIRRGYVKPGEEALCFIGDLRPTAVGYYILDGMHQAMARKRTRLSRSRKLDIEVYMAREPSPGTTFANGTPGRMPEAVPLQSAPGVPQGEREKPAPKSSAASIQKDAVEQVANRKTLSELEVAFTELRERHKERINLIRRDHYDGSWQIATLPALIAVDVVVLIGGKANTYDIGHAARALGKPLIAVPTFGGASGQLWQQTRGEMDAYTRGNPVAAKHVEALENTWLSDHTAPHLLALARFLSERYATSVPDRHIRNLALLIISSLLLWFVAFQIGATSGTRSLLDLRNWWMMFLVLISAGLFGTSAGVLADVWQGKMRYLSDSLLNIHFALGIFVSLVSFLILLVGALAYTGEIMNINATNTDFARIALVSTTLALASTFLLKNSLDRYADYFRQNLSRIQSSFDAPNRSQGRAASNPPPQS